MDRQGERAARCESCKGKEMKTKKRGRGGAEEGEKTEDQREDGQRMRGDG